MPAHAVELAREQGVARQPTRVDADQLMARKTADEQLVVKLGPQATRLDELDARQALAHDHDTSLSPPGFAGLIAEARRRLDGQRPAAVGAWTTTVKTES